MPFPIPDYVPLRKWSGGHRMTMYAWAKPRTLPTLPQPETCYFDTDTDARVLAHCNWQPRRADMFRTRAIQGQGPAGDVEGK